MARTQVQAELIATNAISGTIIADNAITATHIATNSISGVLVQDSGIVTTMIAANNVTAAKIVTNAIQTRHIADDQVTEDKLANAINTSIAAKLPLAGGTMTGDLILGDGIRLELGAASGGDAQLFHSGSNAQFINTTGDTYIQNDNIVYITNEATSKNSAAFDTDGAVTLYHNNSAKLSTTTDGVTVANGTFLVDGLSNYTGLTVKGSGASRPMIQWSNVNQGALGAIYGTEANALVICSGSSNNAALVIQSNGNVNFGGNLDGVITTGNGVKLNAIGVGEQFLWGNSSSNSSSGYHQYDSSTDVYRFIVGYGGTIYATSTSISAISDVRLKENIVDLETGLSEVLALKPRRFDWKNGDATNVAGFIAQEVETVLPDLIGGYKDNNIDDLKSVKMGDMIPTLVKAIQELEARIKTLEG